MSFYEQAYLALVVVAMGALGLVLAWARLITGPHGKSDER
jgi:hypothetical protein